MVNPMKMSPYILSPIWSDSDFLQPEHKQYILNPINISLCFLSNKSNILTNFWSLRYFLCIDHNLRPKIETLNQSWRQLKVLKTTIRSHFQTIAWNHNYFYPPLSTIIIAISDHWNDDIFSLFSAHFYVY